MKKLKISLVVICLIISANAFAENKMLNEKPNAQPKVNLQPFISVGAGYAFYGFDKQDNTTDTFFHKESTGAGFGYSTTVGLNIIQYLSILVSYNNVGQATDRNRVKLAVNSLRFMVRGIFPFDSMLPVKTHVSAFLDLGYANLSYKYTIPVANSNIIQSGEQGAFAYDIGVGYNITKHVMVTSQFGFDAANDIDHRGFVAGLVSTKLRYTF